MTEVKDCNCKHEYQDEKYGKGKRVFNRMLRKKGEGAYFWRCTVCSKEK